VARFEFGCSRLSVLGVERKITKWIDLEGISMARSDAVEMVLEGTSASFAAELLNFSGTKDWVICGDAPESHPSCGFIYQICKLRDLAPPDAQFSRVQSSTQGMSILNRYITFRGDPEAQGPREPPPSRSGPWSAEERQKLGESMLIGNRDHAQMKVILRVGHLLQFNGRAVGLKKT
jgi:hypothetical protein